MSNANRTTENLIGNLRLCAKTMPPFTEQASLFFNEVADRLAELDDENKRLLGLVSDCMSLDVSVWQPIETAPKDGTQFLAWVGEGWNGRMPFVITSWRGYWVNEFGNGCAVENFAPTHWMPLPPPPSTDNIPA